MAEQVPGKPEDQVEASRRALRESGLDAAAVAAINAGNAAIDEQTPRRLSDDAAAATEGKAEIFCSF